jgi:hypothetical protein
LKIFKGSIQEVDPSEKLSRFLTHKKHIRNDGTVHPCAFEPDTRKNPHQLSVFRIDRLIEDKIWSIGKKVAEKNRWTLYGSADIIASAVIEKKLVIKPDYKPKGHANIINWPDKQAWKLITKQLAAEASTVLLNNA